MRLLPLLLLFFPFAAPQDKDQDPKFPKEPIRGWKYTRKDERKVPKPDGKPGETATIEEVTIILSGEEAIPVDFEKKIFDLRGVNASYFTEPEKNKKSKEIQVRSDRGRYDQFARFLRLEGNVVIVRKNNDETPPQTDTVLHAPSVLLRFEQVYECPKCRLQKKIPGRCASDNLDLKEVTVTSVQADRDFEMTGPQGILTGEGLVTDDAMKKEYHITKDGFIEFEGDPSAATSETQKRPSEARFLQVFSRGPLHVLGDEHHRFLQGQAGVRIDRIDSEGTLTIQARDMTIEMAQTDADDGNPGPPEVADVDAHGKVTAEGVLFADGTWFRTTSDVLTRSLDHAQKIETTRLLSTGENLVHLTTGTSTIESRTVKMIREHFCPKDGAEPETGRSGGGVSEFENVERSELMAGTQRFALKCDTLKTTARPDPAGKTNLDAIEAHGHVRLGGLLPADPKTPAGKDDPGRAEADSFYWDSGDQRGWLEATPFVRILQGPSTLLAPKVVMSKNIMVLKGPKQVHLIQEHDGDKEDYRATCEGDMVFDQDSHRLVMRERCMIRTGEMILHSDRINARLTESGGGQGLESLLALGGVTAYLAADHTTIYGDRLAFRFPDAKRKIQEDLRVYGNPNTVTDTGRATTTQEQIHVYERDNPKTGGKIRYTEFIGAGEGVHFEIEDHNLPPAKPPPKK